MIMAVMKEIIERRSRKSFMDKDIPLDVLEELVRAAQLSPSCFNNQPGRFILVTGDEREKLHPALSRGNAWAKSAPALLALASKPDLDCQITGRDYFMLGCGLELENLILQAVHRGLFAHPFAGFKEDIAIDVLGIPDEYRVLVLIAIGHPDPEEVLEEKGRKPLEEVGFHQRWGNPITRDSKKITR